MRLPSIAPSRAAEGEARQVAPKPFASVKSSLCNSTFPPSLCDQRKLSSHQRHSKSLSAGLCARSLPFQNDCLTNFPEKDHDDADIQDLVGELSGDRSVHANLGVVAR